VSRNVPAAVIAWLMVPLLSGVGHVIYYVLKVKGLI
jgi:hypothetical protein